MVSLDEAVIARITKGNTHFEVLVDSDKALEYKKGKPISIESVLAINEIFKDSRKGDRAPEDELQKSFNTKNKIKIAEEIIRHGDVQLTTEHRRKLVEERRKEIADIISKQGINPQTKLPHPVSRIMNAMEESHVNIDPFKKSQDQIENVLSKIQEVIPISFDRKEILISVPLEFAGKASGIIHQIANVKKEDWKSTAWIAVIEIPAGMQADVYDKLNSLTSGKVEVKEL